MWQTPNKGPGGTKLQTPPLGSSRFVSARIAALRFRAAQWVVP